MNLPLIQFSSTDPSPVRKEGIEELDMSIRVLMGYGAT
jgi:hypothetical protein